MWYRTPSIKNEMAKANPDKRDYFIDSALLHLHHSRIRRATDPRDKIFAFAAQAHALLHSFKPNHTLSASVVYRDFTLQVIQEMVNLDLWFLHMPPHAKRSPDLSDLPSWVLDWTTFPHNYTAQDFVSKGAPPVSTPDFASCGRVVYDAPHNQLVICGLRFDKIANMVGNAEMRAEFIMDSGGRFNVKTLLSWMHAIGLRSLEDTTSHPALWDQFWRTMIGNRLHDALSENDTVSRVPAHWRVPDDADEITFRANIADAQAASDFLSVPRLSDIRRTIMDRIDDTATRKRLFLSERRTLGLCAEWAQVGDELFHVAGARWPVSLRKSSPLSEEGLAHEQSTYHLVAVCYMHGIDPEQVDDALSNAQDIHLV